MQRLSQTSRIAKRGFSIIELLVAISIIALIIAIAFPVVSALTTSTRVEAGLNVAGMSSDVARQWVQAEAWANDASTDNSSAVREAYSGTAALYCPTGEVRIVVNDRDARDRSNFLEDLNGNQNGYEDIDTIDFIQIPDGVGIAGIVRTGPPGAIEIRFIAPPFAIAFNEAGQLNYGDTNGRIYYDANGDGNYTRSDIRAAGYNPSEWGDSRDPDDMDPNGNSSNITSTLALTLPFEAIECVPGIVIYSTSEFEESGFTFDGGDGGVNLGSLAGQWLQDNGETIFFSPHTGIALRDEAE